MSKNRKRDIPVKFMVTAQEKEMIQRKMDEYGTDNMGAYLRNIAINGYVIHVNISQVQDILLNLHRTNSNINQVVKRLNETGNLYREDILDFIQKYDKLCGLTSDVLVALSSIDILKA